MTLNKHKYWYPMANITLESPGVQISETDQSATARNPGALNIFVAGFAPQGPTEELINVGSTNEFQSIFGTPTNAAERYFYYTAKNVLDSRGNLVVSRLPYGPAAGTGYANNYSVLAYPISADGTVAAVTGINGVTSVTGVSGVLYQNATAFLLLPPTSLVITDAQYQSLITNGVTGFNNFYQTSSVNGNYTNTITNFSDLGKAGLLVINTSKYSVDNFYQGYYIGIADNANNNPATNFTNITGIQTVNGFNGNVQVFASIPSSRLDFSLTASYLSQGDASISQVVEKSPLNINFGSNSYNDCLNLVVFKIRNSIYTNNSLLLDYVPTESYAGSLYGARTILSQNGGTKPFDLEHVVNSSNDIAVKVNPNISSLTTWFSGSTPNFSVRVAPAAKNLYADGVYQVNNNSTQDIGNLPLKVSNSLALLQNLDTNQLDVTLEAGLGTVWVGTVARAAALSGTQTSYVSAFDDSFSPDISDLLDQSTGASSPTKVNYSAIVDQFITLVSSRLDHIFIPDALRYIFVKGANTKQSTAPGFVFSRDIYWGLSNLWGNIFSSYVALYGNWIQSNDVFSGQNVWLPFSGLAAQVMANVNQVHFPWTAPAGLNYGVINGIADLAVNPIQKQRDLLYRIGVNAVCSFPNAGGYVIWGQKTALTAPSAFDRINVRRLFLYLEKTTQSILRFFTFEPNTVSTRARVVAALSPIFDQAVTNNGMYDYKIVCNENNNTASVIDQNQLVVSIYVQPTRTAEFILANFIAEPTGVNLSEFTA